MSIGDSVADLASWCITVRMIHTMQREDKPQRQICMVVTAEENTLKDWLDTRVFYRDVASILPKKDAVIFSPFQNV